MIYCHSERTFTTEEVLDILNHPDWTRVITEPPVKPRAGTVFLYHYKDERKKDDWRCDQYHFQNDGIRKQPRSNPQFNKSFFVIRNAEGGKDGRFKRHAYKLLSDHKNLVLIQYIGDESIAVDLPHGNSYDSSSIYRRVCPSTITKIKETSGDALEVQRRLEEQAQETAVPELHQARSLLHIRNTICRLKRKLNPKGRKTRKRKKRNLRGKESKPDVNVKNDERMDKTSTNKEELIDDVSSPPDVKSPNTSLIELAALCENIYLENSENQVTCVPADEDVVTDGAETVEDGHMTDLTPVSNTGHHHYADTVTEHLHNQPHQSDARGVNSLNTTTHVTDDCLSSSQSDDTSKVYHQESVLHDEGLTTDYSTTSRECVVTNRTETITNIPNHFVLLDKDGESISVSDDDLFTDRFCQTIIANGYLAEVSSSLRSFLESRGLWTGETNVSAIARSCSVGTGTKSKLIKPQNNQCKQPITQAQHMALANTDSAAANQLAGALPCSITSLISQVSELWKADLDQTINLINPTGEQEAECGEQFYPTYLHVLAALVVGAFKTKTDVRAFVETLKECPSHIEQLRTENIIKDIDVDGQYKIGKYTLYGKDMMKLDGDQWLDDSVIHAYLHLLQRQYAAEQKGDVLIWECFVYTTWESGYYNEWLYKEYKLEKFDWILLPICRSHHWVLLAANVKQKKVMVINSKQSKATEVDILKHWRLFMQNRSVATDEKLTDWQTIECPVFPQTDGSSCGVYVLMTAEAVLGGVPVTILRNCHVSMYRQYVKERLLKAADEADVAEIETNTGGDNVMTEQCIDGKNASSYDQLKDTVLESEDADGMECITLTEGKLMENVPFVASPPSRSSNTGCEDGSREQIASVDMLTDNECKTTPYKLSDLLQKVLYVSTVGETYDQKTVMDPSFFVDMSENHKKDFSFLAFLCLENGVFGATKPDNEGTSFSTHIRWSCILSGSDNVKESHLKEAVYALHEQLNDNSVIGFRQHNSINVISSILSSNVHFLSCIDLEFIHKYVALRDSRINGDEDAFLIQIDKTSHINLAQRFSQAIVEENFAFVLTHEAFSKHSFNALFIKSLKQRICTLEDLLVQCDKVFGGSFLHWTCFAKTADLYKYFSMLMEPIKEDVAVACCVSGNADILQIVVDELELKDVLSLRAKSKIQGLNINHNVECFETHVLPLLHLACWHGHVSVVTCLLEYGFDVNAQLNDDNGDSGPTPMGSTPVCLAAAQGHTDVVQCLMEHGASISYVDCNFNSPLHLACIKGHAEAVSLLIKKSKLSEQNIEGNTPLHLACQRKRADIACLLLMMQADISLLNYDNNSPLDIACQNGSFEIAEKLLQVCPNPLPYDGSNTPLHKACRGGYANIVILLLRHSMEKTVNGGTRNLFTLTIECTSVERRNAHIQIIKLLIKEGFDMSATFIYRYQNYTPLSWACMYGHTEIVKLLIEKGADVSAGDSNGYSPLTRACMNGHIEIVKLLIEKGADVSAADRYDHSPLTWACRNGHIEIVKLLIEKGADVSAADSGGYIPLTWACMNGHIEIVKLLIEKGADVSACDGGGDSPLTWACRNGHIEIVKLLIEKGADVSAADSGGYIPLTWACMNGHIEIVKLLIEKGADVSACDGGGDSPLTWACRNGHIEIVKLLIEKGADVSAADSGGYIPLTWACMNGHIEIVKLLIEKGADVSAADRYDHSPLTWACRNGHIEIVKLLIEKGADVSACDGDGDSPLAWACENDHIEIVKLLIEKGADVSAADRYDHSPLTWACRNGHIEIVKLLIEKGADVSACDGDGDSPLTWACRNGHIEIVKLLIEKGADVSACDGDGDSPLTWACENDHIEIVKLLIEKGADVSAADRYDHSPLTWACRNGHIEIVKLLIEKGADVSACDGDGDSPLAWACENDHIEIVKLLIEKGADVSAADRYDHSPLTWACRNGHIEIVKLLIEKGADVSACDGDGDSPLTWACRNGHIEIVKLLIEKGADVSACDGDGDSPLTWACENDHIEIVKLLIEKGADVSACDGDGDSPLTWACRNGHIEIVKLLIEKGADVSACDGDGDSPLTWACRNGHIEIVKLLIEKGADVSAADSGGYIPLTWACVNSHIEIVKLLIEKGADVSACDGGGDSPLTWACRNGHIEIVKLLIEKGADVSAADRYDHSPLTWACRNGHIEIVKLLIEKGADVSAADSGGYIPLTWACVNGHIEIVKLLIEKGADVSACDGGGDSPLTRACRNGHIEIVKLLIEKGADVSAADSDGYIPLTLACRNGHIEIVKLLIEKGADVSAADRYDHSPLSEACNNGHIEIIKLLTETGADIKHTKITCGLKVIKRICKIYQYQFPEGLHQSFVQSALAQGDAHTVSLLVQKYIVKSPNAEYLNQLLIDALKGRHIAVFQMLYTMLGANTAHNTFLYIACSLGLVGICNDLLKKSQIEGKCLIATLSVMNIKLTEMFIEKGVDLFSCDHERNSTLHLACALGDDGVVDKLVTRGVDVSGNNAKLQTPLHIACENGYLGIVQHLLNSGADVTKRDYLGDTVLHIALKKRSYTLFHCLLQHCYHLQILQTVNMPVISNFVKQMLNVENKQQETSVHVACGKNNVDIVKLLLTEGADVTKRDDRGNTVLHIACSRGGYDLVLCILHHCYHIQKLQTVRRSSTISLVQQMINLENKELETPLHAACRKGNLNIVELLLTHGADVTSCDKFGQTGLHIGCERNNILLLKRVLQHCDQIQSRQMIVDVAGLFHAVDTNGESALHIACRKNSAEAMKLLVMLDLNIFLSDKKGNTPVSLTEKNVKYFQMFCESVPNTSVTDCEGNSLLHLACQKGSTSCVKVLLEREAEVSVCNMNGEYPIHKAAENDNAEIIQLLLQNNSDVNASNKDCQSPLYVSCAEGNTQVVGLLIQNGATINLEDKLALSPLHMACKGGHRHIVEILIKSGAEIDIVDAKSNSPLYYACEEGHTNCASLLLENVGEINLSGYRGNTPLHRACAQGHESVVTLLLSCGADPMIKNSSGHIPLYHAVLNNHLKIVEKLTEGKQFASDTSLDVHVLFQTACSRGHVEILRYLFHTLSKPTGSPLTSLLHAAVESKHLNIIDILKDHGCDVKQEDESGHTIFHVLCSSDNTDVQHLKRVLDMDLDVGDVTKRGKTALHIASQRGNVDTVKFILQKGINVHSKDYDGNTALHEACSKGQFAIADLLIQRGLSLNETNAKGATPLDAAIANKQYAVPCVYDQWFTLTQTYPKISLMSLRHICSDKQIRLLYNVELVFSDKDMEGNSPLHIACQEEATDIIQLLIISGAWLLVGNASGDFPVHVACHRSYDVLQALLDTPMDVNVLQKMLSIPDKNGNSSLHIVTYEKNLPSMRLLLQKRANVSSVNNFDQSALHIACYGRDPHIVTHLLSAFANITAQDKYGNTPLHIICTEGNLDLLNCVGFHPAYINLTNFENRTPFHEAVKHQHYEMVREMMSLYFNVSIESLHGNRLNHFIEDIGIDNFVKVLMSEELHIKSCFGTIVPYVADTLRPDIVSLFAKGETSPSVSVSSTDNKTPLHVSALRGHKDIVKLLLPHVQDVNQKTSAGKTPLYLACQSGHAEIADILLRAGSDMNSVDNENNTVLHVAAIFDRGDIIVLLSRWGMTDTNVNATGETALHIACTYGYTESSVMLLKMNSNILQENKDKKTPLLLACEKGYEPIAEILVHKLWIKSKLEELKDMSAPAIFKYKNCLYKCLISACRENQLGIIRILLKYECNVNYSSREPSNNDDADVGRIPTEDTDSDIYQQKPLYVACREGHIDVVNVLIQSGATLEGRGNSNDSPLHIASLQGHSDIVSLLLKKGVSPSPGNAEETTALNSACQQGHGDVVEMLLEAGANCRANDRDGKKPFDVCSDEGFRTKLLQSTTTPRKRKGDDYEDMETPEKKSRY